MSGFVGILFRNYFLQFHFCMSNYILLLDLAATEVNSKIWGIKQTLVSNKNKFKTDTERFTYKSDEPLQLPPLHSGMDQAESTAHAAKEKDGFPILKQPSEADSSDQLKVATSNSPQPEIQHWQKNARAFVTSFHSFRLSENIFKTQWQLRDWYQLNWP